MGEPLYQCQPPTGYGDRATDWISTGALVSRMNFAGSLAANGVNAAKIDLPQTEAGKRGVALRIGGPRVPRRLPQGRRGAVGEGPPLPRSRVHPARPTSPLLPR